MKEKLREFKKDILDYKDAIQAHYGDRNQEFVPAIRRNIQRYN